MLRFVVDQSGNLRLDSARSAGGRGAWLCANPECLNNALKRRLFQRSFKRKIAVTDGIEFGEQIENSFRILFDSAVYGAQRNRALVDSNSAVSFEADIGTSNDLPERWGILDEVWHESITEALKQYRTWKISSAEFCAPVAPAQ